MIDLFFFETEDEATEAANRLQLLGLRAINLLSEVIESQGINRCRASNLARSLENEGFIFIDEGNDPFENQINIKPSLSGEEAMLIYESIFKKDSNCRRPDQHKKMKPRMSIVPKIL